jgi:hypothetical protein
LLKLLFIHPRLHQGMLLLLRKPIFSVAFETRANPHRVALNADLHLFENPLSIAI